MRPHGPDPLFPLWTFTCTRSTRIHTALLKWLVYNDLPDIKLKFNYMILIYLNCTISNLYHRKISTFFLSKDEILAKRRQLLCMRRRLTSVDSNFNFLCGRPHGAGPPPPSTCVHLSLTPSPSVWAS